MPPNAVLVFNYWHKNFVQNVGPGLAEGVVGLAPAGHQADLAGEGDVRGREADGDDVVLVEDRPVKVQKSHVEPVRLGQHVPELYCTVTSPPQTTSQE